ncbi:MAG: MarR family transcriptional regulator [Acidobacteria bacterium]|nr:MarR family transcriptional regulator [Acidobacteriota bacterium]
MDDYQELFDLIGELARRRYQLAERHFAAFGLNHTEARLLTLLARAGGETAQDALSNQLFVDRTNAGRGLKSLEQAGLIERRANAGDKRTKTVRITEKGRQTVAAMAGVKNAMARNFFGGLQEDEAGAVLGLLRKALADE